MLEISYFPSATDNMPSKTVTVKQILEDIQNGVYSDKIKHLRSTRETSEDLYKLAKKRLPAVTFAAKFNGIRNTETPFLHTGIVLADIDGLNGKKSEYKEALSKDNHTAFLFESPSNDGLKVGFMFNGEIPDDETHKRCWFAIEKYIKEKFGIDIDPSGKDVSRLCFVSYDPSLFKNPSCSLFEMPPEELQKSNESDLTPPAYTRIFDNNQNAEYAQIEADKALEMAYDKIIESQAGEKHFTRLRMSRLVGGYVGGGLIDYEIAKAKLIDAAKWNGTKDLRSATKTIEDGLKYGMSVPISREQIESEREQFKMENYLRRVNDIAVSDGGEDDTVDTHDTVDTIVTDDAKPTEIQNTLFSLLYNRIARARARIKGMPDLSETVSPEDLVLGVKSGELTQGLELSDKKEIEAIGYSCYTLIHPRYTLDTPLIHPPPTEKKPQKQLDVKGKVLEWIQDSFGWFTCRELYEALGAKHPNEKSVIRIALNRLSKEDVIEKNRTQNGTYRKIDNECEEIDFMTACDDFIDLWLPFQLNTMARILPGNIIVLAGSPNAGKTALMLNIIRYNLVKNWKIYYFNSEMGADEMRLRLKLFKDMTLEDWGRYRDDGLFNPKTRSHDFQDVIVPGDGNINVIDYLEMHDNFWEVGGILRDIHDRLNGAICFVALQKPRGRDTAKGGDITLEKPRLYLSVENGVIKIVKMKSFQGNENPNGKQIKFRLVQGSEIITDGGWHYSK